MGPSLWPRPGSDPSRLGSLLRSSQSLENCPLLAEPLYARSRLTDVVRLEGRAAARDRVAKPADRVPKQRCSRSTWTTTAARPDASRRSHSPSATNTWMPRRRSDGPARSDAQLRHPTPLLVLFVAPAAHPSATPLALAPRHRPNADPLRRRSHSQSRLCFTYPEDC